MDDGRQHGYELADTINYRLLKEFAVANRRHQTLAERQLWDELSRNRYHLKFRRQHIIGNYIADFVCLRHRLIIEVDGGYHAQDTQQSLDYLRTGVLANMGFTVIRFTNGQVEASPAAVAKLVYAKIFDMWEKKEEKTVPPFCPQL